MVLLREGKQTEIDVTIGRYKEPEAEKAEKPEKPERK